MANDKAKQISNEQRQLLAQFIIDSIEQGGVQRWHAGWKPYLLAHKNGKSGRYYNGVNRLWLSYAAMLEQYGDCRWYTFDSIKYAKGLHLRKGSHATHIEYWDRRPWYKRDASGEYVLDEDGKKVVDHYYMKLCAVHNVFNGSCIEGLEPMQFAPKPDEELFDIADKFIELAKMGGKFAETSDASAYYVPATNTINLPVRGSFDTARDFLATLLHEFAHSTKAQTRMGRKCKEFDSPRAEYAYEELVAELTALFVQADLGLDSFGSVTENSTAYLAHWAERTADEDTTAQIMSAISEAQRVADWMREQYEQHFGKLELAA